MQQPQGAQPIYYAKPSRATPVLLSLVALLLAGILACLVYQVYMSQQPRLSASTRAALLNEIEATDTALIKSVTTFSKDVFSDTTAKSAIQQQVLELQYVYEMQVLIAEQNSAMLRALLNS